MEQSNVYAQRENGDLRLIAEIEGLNDPALAIDALLDEMPRLKMRKFVVINLDSVVTVEVDSDDIVQPRRAMTISNGASVAVPSDETVEEDAEEEDEPDEAEEEEAPEEAPQQRRRRKPAAQRGRSGNGRRKPAARGGRKSPFKSNPASAE